MAETTIKNKSEFVRGVLQKIGAITENPPKEWRKQVETALAEQNLKMHQVMIYQIRKKMMDQATPYQTPQRVKPGKPGIKPIAYVNPTKSTLTAENLLTVQKFAIDFGGTQKLIEALNMLDLLSQK